MIETMDSFNSSKYRNRKDKNSQVFVVILHHFFRLISVSQITYVTLQMARGPLSNGYDSIPSTSLRCKSRSKIAVLTSDLENSQLSKSDELTGKMVLHAKISMNPLGQSVNGLL